MEKIEQPEKTVLVDMDGVKAKFDTHVINQLLKRYPDLPLLPQRENFYVGDDYPGLSDDVREIIMQPGFFRSLPVMEGAVEGIQTIIDAGYTPRICSSPIRNHPTCKAEKLAWLDDFFVPHFGAWVVETAIITRSKEEHDGIALIDDRPDVLALQHFAPWRHIMFDHPFNRRYATDFRLYGWDDSNLPNLLYACEELYLQRQSDKEAFAA